MKTLYKKASHLRAHTWKDVGGVGGILLDLTFFVFLLVVSVIVIVIGSIAVMLDFLFSPLLTLLTMGRRSPKKEVDEAVLQEDGTLTTRSCLPSETTGPEASPGRKKG